MQVYEKYVNLARDATSSGDRIAAESYQQYAEHYYRIINDTTDPQRPAPQTVGSAGSEGAGAEPSEAEHGSPERAGRERQKGGRQPYPTDAEQPFVEGGAKTAESTAASTAASTGASEGNGQAPEAGPATKPGSEEDGEPPAVDGDGAAEAAPAAEAKAKPRGRGRPRARAKAGNGAATEGDAEGAVTPASGEPCKAGEPSS
jgi:hypothetical protein